MSKDNRSQKRLKDIDCEKIQEIDPSAIINDCELDVPRLFVGAKSQLNGVRISAPEVRIGSGVRIEPSVIQSSSPVVLDDNVWIREGVVLNAFKGIHLGERTKIDRHVIVGGMQSERSEFVMGVDCMVSHHSYLNVTREIHIGDRSGVGGFSFLFTHGAWQNIFKGFPVNYGPVIFEEDVYTGWNIFIVPNVTIGRGATIGAGAVVTKNVPPYALALGIPAKIIPRPELPKQMSLSEKHQIAQTILNDYENYIQGFLGITTTRTTTQERILLESKDDFLFYNSSIDADLLKHLPNKAGTIVSFAYPSEIQKTLEQHQFGWVLLDPPCRSHTLTNLGQVFVKFLGRYGIRHIPERNMD